MADYSNFYEGGMYGLEPPRDNSNILGFDYTNPAPSGSFALTTRPDTANQIKEVAEKLNTGVKNIEVTAIAQRILEAIPNQHLDEIRRLKDLTGTSLTLHGPLVEPTGVGEGGWDELKREYAERQMWQAVERSHRLDPKGNIIVTFHSSNGLPDPETQIINEDGKPETVQISVINERTGQAGPMQKPSPNYFLGEEKPDPYKQLAHLNQERWNDELNSLGYNNQRGINAIEGALLVNEEIAKEKPQIKEGLMEMYKLSVDNPQEYNKQINKIKEEDQEVGKLFQNQINKLSDSGIFTRSSYTQFQELFNKAWKNVNPHEQQKLKDLRDEMAKKVESYKEDPEKIQELAQEIQKGVQVLGSLKQIPEQFKPIRQFAIEKASDTFSNIAFNAYKEFHDTAPIISIENPPVGMGLSRAQDLKDLIKETRKKFVIKAEKDGLSKSQAEDQANKLIGATWDVGHINMLRKYGFEEEHITAETKTIAKDVKHIHLSDNFGMEHTELPMGMGNVPTKKHFDLLKEYNSQAEKLKKVIETGDWYQHFQTTPLTDTLAAFGSPIYAMKMAPYWQKQQGLTGAYYAGYGLTNPDFHQSIYGAGFTALPVELGGQVSGGRNRLSGSPME